MSAKSKRMSLSWRRCSRSLLRWRTDPPPTRRRCAPSSDEASRVGSFELVDGVQIFLHGRTELSDCWPHHDQYMPAEDRPSPPRWRWSGHRRSPSTFRRDVGVAVAAVVKLERVGRVRAAAAVYGAPSRRRHPLRQPRQAGRSARREVMGVVKLDLARLGPATRVRDAGMSVVVWVDDERAGR